MTRATSSVAFILAALLGTLVLTEAKPMTSNQRYLDQAQAHVKEFEVTLEPERLREAYIALENVILVNEHGPKARADLRANCLSIWLHLLQLLDQLFDSNFNPEDVPEDLVQPPPTTGGIVYPPGADPALIADPRARAEYEKAIAANRKKIESYRLQLHMSRLKERIEPRAEAFIRNSYKSTPGDQEELRTAIKKTIQDPRRKERLLKLLTPPPQ
jgi:hypothetical protein